MMKIEAIGGTHCDVWRLFLVVIDRAGLLAEQGFDIWRLICKTKAHAEDTQLF